jgi:hypothetical protein
MICPRLPWQMSRASAVFLGEEGRRFSQELGLHTEFPVLAFQFAQSGAFR